MVFHPSVGEIRWLTSSNPQSIKSHENVPTIRGPGRAGVRRRRDTEEVMTMRSLFNGKDLSGWKGDGYVVEDGTIVCTPAAAT